MATGRVYPTFYSKLYVDLREELAAVAVAARATAGRVWEQDQTLTGFMVKSRAKVQDELVILPKLFRRLTDYLVLEGPTSVAMSGFRAFLAAKDDRLYTVPSGQATALDTLVELHDRVVTLTVPPEQIIFLEA